MKYYSTPEDVIRYAGIHPPDLGFEEDQEDEVKELIEHWLVQIKDVMDQETGVDFHKAEGGVPPGIDHIAMRAAANVVAQASYRRESTIVQVDDYHIEMLDDNIFTESIMRDLRKYARKNKISIMVVKGDRNE